MRPVRRADNLTAFMCRLHRNSGSLKHPGALRACPGIALRICTTSTSCINTTATHQESHLLNSLVHSTTDSTWSCCRKRPATKEPFFTFQESLGCLVELPRRCYELYHRIRLCFGQRDTNRVDEAEQLLEDNITRLLTDAEARLQAGSKTMTETRSTAF